MVRGSGRTAAPVTSRPAYLPGAGDVAYRPPGVIRQMGGTTPTPPPSGRRPPGPGRLAGAMRGRMEARSTEMGLPRRESAGTRAEYGDVKDRSERDIAKMHGIVAEMAAELTSLRGRLAAYDNAHMYSPGSTQGARGS